MKKVASAMALVSIAGGSVAVVSAANSASAANTCHIYVNDAGSKANVWAKQGRIYCSGGTVAGSAQLRRSKPFTQDATDVKISWSGVNVELLPNEPCGIHGHGTYYGSFHGGGDHDGAHSSQC